MARYYSRGPEVHASRASPRSGCSSSRAPSSRRAVRCSGPSITSPSDWVSGTGRSISGSFEGISTSSGSGGGVAQAPDPYRDDVRVYTAAVLGRGPAEPAFPAGARTHRAPPRDQPLGGPPLDLPWPRRRRARRGSRRGGARCAARPTRPRGPAGASARPRRLPRREPLSGVPRCGAAGACARCSAPPSPSPPRRRRDAGSAPAEIAFVYVEGNVGGASGGHTALRFGEEAYDFEVQDGDVLRLRREPWRFMRHRYSNLYNRPLHVASVRARAGALAARRGTTSPPPGCSSRRASTRLRERRATWRSPRRGAAAARRSPCLPRGCSIPGGPGT